MFCTKKCSVREFYNQPLCNSCLHPKYVGNYFCICLSEGKQIADNEIICRMDGDFGFKIRSLRKLPNVIKTILIYILLKDS